MCTLLSLSPLIFSLGWPVCFFCSSRRRHTRLTCDWSSDVCSSDLAGAGVTLSGGQAAYSGAAGATATFTFSGTGVSWIGMKCEQCGIARVHLDGAVVATVDTYAPTRPATSGAMYTT